MSALPRLLEMGVTVAEADLKIVKWPSDSEVADALSSFDDVKGKALVVYWSYDGDREDYQDESLGATARGLVSTLTHFFTRTRWTRTFRVIRGFPDSQLGSQELPINPGNPNP